MPPFENIPRDVLQHIAFLVAASSDLEPSRHLFHLLLTSSTIYRSLNLCASPHLYASIFRTKFDIVQGLHEQLTDSALTSEWVRRCCLLQRVRRCDLSPEKAQQDLWAALRMILENNGLNDAHLFAAGFPAFIMNFAKAHLSRDDIVTSSECEVGALATWLLCFTLSHQIAVDASAKTREDILMLLRPSATHVRSAIGVYCHPSPSTESGGSSHGIAHNVIIDRDNEFEEPSSAAIILTFALNEALKLAIPPHLPENRAIAVVTHRSGPTMEDFRAVASCRTPLFADIRHGLVARKTSSDGMVDPDHKSLYDTEFYRAPRLSYGFGRSSARPYIPGTFTGVWEGSYMLSNAVKPKTGDPCAFGDFTCRKPMQWAISEYLCFSPRLPISNGDVLNLNLSLCQSQAGFESYFQTLGYEKYSLDSIGDSNDQRDPSEALDILIVGETLRDHEQAWGAFRFVGRVLSDGLIVVKREPKNADDENLGTWIFEGRLRYGVAFVGHLRSSTPTEDYDIRGIFSLHKGAPVID